MNYWLTTRWPPYTNEPSNHIEDAISIADGRESAGNEIKRGDEVLIYQTKSGKTLVRNSDGTETRLGCQEGRGGIIAVGTVTGPMAFDASVRKPELYSDGREVFWRWNAPIEITDKSGYVPLEFVLATLGYKPGYNMRGFGDKHSGLKKLQTSEFEVLIEEYESSR